MLPPKLLVAALVLSALPIATAHHGCDASPYACVGGMWHEEGEGDCPAEARRSYLVIGAEGSPLGSHLLVGVGWTCDEGEVRTGVFGHGLPTDPWAGTYESDERCGVEVAAVLGVTYEQAAREDALTCMLP